MWYDNLKENWPEYFKRKLGDESQFVDLGDLYAGLDVSAFLMEGKVHEAREKTLTFLHKLLVDNEVKVGRYTGGDGIATEYTGTPDEIVNTLRTEWNNTVEGVVNKNSGAFEMCTHIVLKENPWPIWR